jgi:outer membrane biosynthesis protein TonB
MNTKTIWFLAFACSTLSHILFATIIFFCQSLNINQQNLPSIIDIDLVSEHIYKKPPDVRTMKKNQSETISHVKTRKPNEPCPAKKSISNYEPKPRHLSSEIKQSLKKKTIKRVAKRKHKRGKSATAEFMDTYKAEVMACIQRNWALSYQLTDYQPKLRATIEMIIMKSGLIRSDIWLKKKSGNDYFDECVMKAVEKSNPLPPLPNGYLRPYYGPVAFTFTLSGLK